MSKHFLYNHCKRLQDNFEVDILPYMVGLSGTPGLISHSYIEFWDMSVNVFRKYQSLIGFISTVYEVTIMYNQFNFAEGIYLVGDKNLLPQVQNVLFMVTSKIEKCVDEAPITKFNKTKSRLVIRSECRSKCIDIYEKLFDKLATTRGNEFDSASWKIINANRSLRQAYIQQTQLKRLKQF